MAKFCTRCGRPLEEGQVCDCMKEVSAPTQELNQEMANEPVMSQEVNQMGAVPAMDNSQVQYHAPAQQNVVGEFFKKVYFTFMNVIKAPATKGSALAASGDMETGFGLIGVQAIFTALFALFVCSKINSLLGVLSFLDLDINIYMPTAFFVTFLISVLLSVIYGLLIWGASVLFKNPMTFKQAISTVSVRSIIAIPCIVVSMLVFLLNPFYGLVIFFVSAIGGICYIQAAYPVVNPAVKNRVALIVFLSTFVFVLVAVFIMSKSVQFYIPSDIKDQVSSFLSNPSSIFDGMYDYY